MQLPVSPLFLHSKMAPIKSKALMIKIKEGVAAKGEQMVKDVKGVIQNIIKGGDDGEWVIDLKNGKGKVYLSMIWV